MTSNSSMTLIDVDLLQRLQNDIDKELEFKKKLRELLDELDRELRKAQAFISMVHFLSKEQLQELDRQIAKELLGSHGSQSSQGSQGSQSSQTVQDINDLIAKIGELANQQPYHKYNGMWSRHMEIASFILVFLAWLGLPGAGVANRQEATLPTYKQVADAMGVPTDVDENKFHLSIEEYLHSLISLINELSRLAVNSVTMGDYERPLVISRFVKELSTAFQILNLKNDNLRKRFDSIKYDVKKIEEVVYDLSLRGLIPRKTETATPAESGK